MSLNVTTLADLRSEIEDACELPVITIDTNITLVMVRRWINRSVNRLTARLLTLHGDDYFTETANLSTSSGVATVGLPARCMRVKSLVWVKSSDDRRVLERASTDDLTDFGASPVDARAWEGSPRYALVGQTMTFVPVPAAVYSLKIMFVQGLADLYGDGDELDVGLGWEDWIVQDVAIRVMKRQERDQRPFLDGREDAWADIVAAAADRDESGPRFSRRLSGRGMSARARYDRETF